MKIPTNTESPSPAPPSKEHGITPVLSLRKHKVPSLAILLLLMIVAFPGALVVGMHQFQREAAINVSPPFITPINAEHEVEPQSSRPHGVDANALARVSERWAKEWSAKNLEAVVALYTDDAVFLPSIGTRVTGRQAIRDLFQKALASQTSDLHVHSRVTEQSGSLAYDSGEYEETSTSGGVTQSGRGNYLVVLRRHGKDQWRIVEHMWTDLPTAAK